MKRVLSTLVVLVMIISVLGVCSCTPQAQPSPGITPQITDPGAGMSPDVGTSPGIGTSPGVGMSPGLEGMIPNFLVGTIIPIEDVPAIKQAIEAKYPQATIESVTHAENQGEQVYSVTLIDKDAKNVQVFVEADGTIMEDNGAGNGSPEPATGTSPKS